MFIYQIERDLLQESVRKYGHVLRGRVLDVGCGARNRYSDAVKNCEVYVKLDNNPECKPDIVGSADNMPIQAGEYDSIICTQVLGDLVRPEKVITEFSRILKTGGIALVTEGFMNELHGEPRDYWRFTPYGLKALFEENGFTVTAVELVGSWPAVITQMITRLLINSLDLYKRPMLGKMFNVCFRLTGILVKPLDKMFLGKRKYGLDTVIVAKKI